MKKSSGKSSGTKSSMQPAKFRVFNPTENPNSPNIKPIPVIPGQKMARGIDGNGFVLRWRGCVG